MRLRITLAGALACAITAGVARAQPSAGDKSAAQALFDEARRLTAEQRWADACPKLAESQRLDPSMGTQFYLAECLEHVGRVATAWTDYLEVADAARAAGLADRDRYARARADALQPRLARLTVRVSIEAARTPDLEVTRDGEALGRAQWATAIPLDPGEHEITASAPGKQRWTTKVKVEEATALEVTVPALEDARAAAPPIAPPPIAPPPGLSRLHVAGIVTGAVGIVGLGIGTGFGVAAIVKKNESNSAGFCDAANTCDATGKGLRRDSLHAATASTIAFVAGSAAVAASAVLLVIAPSSPRRPPAGAALSLGIGPGSLSLAGRW